MSEENKIGPQPRYWVFAGSPDYAEFFIEFGLETLDSCHAEIENAMNRAEELTRIPGHGANNLEHTYVDVWDSWERKLCARWESGERLEYCEKNEIFTKYPCEKETP